MVSYPDWAEDIFTDEELSEIYAGDGWSKGVVIDPETGEEYPALIEHFDSRFDGEARAYLFEKEQELYVYETKSDFGSTTQDASYYVKSIQVVNTQQVRNCS